MSTRDKDLDYLRAFAMLQVITVHTLYWGLFISNTYINIVKSWCLFEMPLFFFIIGASNSFKDVNNYLEFVKKRFARILIPYWAFAVICAVLSVYMYDKIVGASVDVARDIVISWLIPWDKQVTIVPYLNWAVWFVPVYLCIVLLIPILKYIKNTKYKNYMGVLMLFIFMGMEILHMEWIKNVVFYALWTYIGLFYNDIKACMTQKVMKRKSWIWIGINLVAIIALCYTGYTLDMQNNKFPPNLIFGAYAFVMMTLILLRTPFLTNVFQCLEKVPLIDKVIKLFSTRSMTIFLYQVFAFNVSIPLTNKLIPSVRIRHLPIKILFCWIVTMAICIGLSVLFGKIEEIDVSRVKKGNAKR